jgi:hypothetical protein
VGGGGRGEEKWKRVDDTDKRNKWKRIDDTERRK